MIYQKAKQKEKYHLEDRGYQEGIAAKNIDSFILYNKILLFIYSIKAHQDGKRKSLQNKQICQE